MIRRTIILTATMAALSLLVMAATALAASSKTNVTVSNGTVALSYDSNIVVAKDAPNPQFTTSLMNLSNTELVCGVYLVEADAWSAYITLEPGQQAPAVIGWGTGFPSTKQSTIHYRVWCNAVLQVTATSKMTLTDHAGL